MPVAFSRLYHLSFGVLNLIALSITFYLSLKVIPFFFSYFTVLSNISITLLFLYFGLFNPKKLSKSIEWIYGAVVLYMSITGIIYWTILVNNHSLQTDPWINLTLHGLMPIVAFVGWLLFPPRNKILFKNSWQWLVPPLIFVGYTLIRGPIVNWYPYPFLNPIISKGYQHVFINVLAILIFAWILSLVLIWLGNILRHKK